MCIKQFVRVCRVRAYRVGGALQKKIDGSVYILVAVMQGYHALILGFPRNFNQLRNKKTQANSIRLKYHFTQCDNENLVTLSCQATISLYHT